MEDYVHFIMMRNIANCPRNRIESSYDLKGSSYDREVLKKKPNANIKTTTLKDLDFLKIQKSLLISDYYKDWIIISLYNDLLFLKNHKIIDYSLLVIRVNKGVIEEEDFDKDCNNFKQVVLNNEFFSIPSISEPDIFYHIAIIDYLQKYNIKKIMEKYGKKFIKMNKDLDTSSQNPRIYAERFYSFMKLILK